MSQYATGGYGATMPPQGYPPQFQQQGPAPGYGQPPAYGQQQGGYQQNNQQGGYQQNRPPKIQLPQGPPYQQGEAPQFKNQCEFIGQVYPNDYMPHGFSWNPPKAGGQGTGFLLVNVKLRNEWTNNNETKVRVTYIQLVVFGQQGQQVMTMLQPGAEIWFVGEFRKTRYQGRARNGGQVWKQKEQISLARDFNGAAPIQVLRMVRLLDEDFKPQQQQQQGYGQQPYGAPGYQQQQRQYAPPPGMPPQMQQGPPMVPQGQMAPQGYGGQPPAPPFPQPGSAPPPMGGMPQQGGPPAMQAPPGFNQGSQGGGYAMGGMPVGGADGNGFNVHSNAPGGMPQAGMMPPPPPQGQPQYAPPQQQQAPQQGQYQAPPGMPPVPQGGQFPPPPPAGALPPPPLPPGGSTTAPAV